MKQRFGGLLSLALGIVLIFGGGIDGSGTAAAGAGTPTCVPNQIGQVAPPCPTSAITFTENTVNGTGAATPPAHFQVTISSSNCTDPSGAPLAQIVSVPNGGSASSGQLFIYTSPGHATKCSYAFVETPAAGFTASFNPASPVTLPARGDRAVALTNTFVTASSSSSSSSASSSSSSASASATVLTPSPTASVVSATPVSSQGSAGVAKTGPSTQVQGTLLAGIALCLLGLALLFAGKLPSRHR